LYRQFASLCCVITALSATSAALAVESGACREIRLRFETIKPQISAIEVSLTLFSAAGKNCLELVSELLDHGASVDARDRFGARPLSHAARFGHLPVVDLLLAHGAPIDARNLAGATALFFAGRGGVTPLAVAAYRGNDTIAEALLARGANDRATDETGKSPIIYAAAAGWFDVLTVLLARNVDINARYANDLTLLMWASGPDESAPEPQAIKVVRQLLDLGARIDDRDARGRTPLMIAAEGGHAGIADLLLARGADPELKDKDGKRAADLTVLTLLRERLTPR
jgi:ankyrin repeat protein